MNIDLPEDVVAKLLAALTAAKSAPAPAPTEAPVPGGYVKLPVTGHVLPLPVESEWSFWGYAMNAYDEAKGVYAPGPMTATRMIKQAATVLGKTEGDLVNDRSAWPVVVDLFYNIDAYDPDGKAQRAAEAAQAEKADWVSRTRAAPARPDPTPRPTPADPDPGVGDVDVPIEQG